MVWFRCCIINQRPATELVTCCVHATILQYASCFWPGHENCSIKVYKLFTTYVTFRFLTVLVVLNLLLSLIHAVKQKEGIVVFYLCG